MCLNGNESVSFQKYVECGDNITSLILAIVTPLRKRVHGKVGGVHFVPKEKISLTLLFFGKNFTSLLLHLTS